MGDYVATNHGYSGTWASTTEDEIEEIFTYLRTKADTSEATLANALTELSNLYPNFLSNKSIPGLPNVAPITNFNWSADTISTEMYLTLFNQISTDIANGGTGFSDEIHAAIVARELSARRLSEKRTYQGALDNVGGDGFALPSGQIASMELEFARDIEVQNQAILNDLLAKDFELTQKNKEFAITSGLQLEEMIRTTFTQMQGYNLDAAKAAQIYIIQVFDATLKRFDLAWKGIQIDLEAHKIDVNLAEKIAEVRASVAVQSLASALGGINASMSLGSSSSFQYSKSRGWTVANTLSEQHPFVDREY